MIDLGGNRLTGTIPESLYTLGGSLRVIHSQKHTLTGTILPCIGDLTALEEIKIDENQLSGLIPKQMGNLVSRGM